MPTVTEAPRMPLIEVVVPDPMDAAAVPRVSAVLDDAIALRPAHLVVDLTACCFIDAAGIELLVDAHRRTWSAGGRLTLQGLSPRLYRILQIARVDRVLHTASAPAGYQPRHRAERRRTDDAIPADHDEVRPDGLAQTG
jgi:anti-anti-sigma factor